MEWATRARLIDPDNANLQYNLACAMSSLGEKDLAIEALAGIASKLSPGIMSWLEADTDLYPIRGDAALHVADGSSESAIRLDLERPRAYLLHGAIPAWTLHISPELSMAIRHTEVS